MSGSTNETEDGDGVFSMDSTDSPLVDEGNSGGSTGGAHVLKKGPWTPAEDAILVDYVKKHGEGNWNAVQRQSGLFRCGKSCRLRWANHLRPNLKKGAFTPEEEHMIIELHSKFGNKWARMASHLSGRTDNEIKNYWNTRIKRRQRAGLPIYPVNIQQQGGHGNDNNNEIQTSSILKNDSFDMSNGICEGLKTSNNMFAEIPCLPDISPADILTKSFSAPSYFGFNSPSSFPSQQKEMSIYSEREGGRSLSMVEQAKAVERRYALSFPYRPPTGNERLFHFMGSEGRCSLPNCTISSSSSRIPASYGCTKSELPSFQYQQQPYGGYQGSCSSYLPQFPEHGEDPSFLRARASPAVEPGVVPSPNSGLLDALLHESYNLSSAANHSSDQSTSAAVPSSEKASSSAPVASSQRTSSGKSSADTPPALMGSEWNVSSDTEKDEYWDMFSGMGESVASIFYDSDQNISIEGLMEEHLPPTLPYISGCNRKQEEVQEYDPGGVEDEYGRRGKENVMTDEVLSCFFGRKVEGNGGNHGGSEMSWSVLWNNMPPIFQMSDHHLGV